MVEFVTHNLSYVFFSYGLAFLVLLFTSYLLHKVQPNNKLWGSLCTVSVLYILSIIVNIVRVLSGDSNVLLLLETFFVGLAFIFLIEYSRTKANKKYGSKIKKRWYLLLLLASIVTGAFVSGMSGVELYVRLVMGTVACLWASYTIHINAAVGKKECSTAFALAFLLFAVLQGLTDIFAPSTSIGALLYLLGIAVVLFASFILWGCFTNWFSEETGVWNRKKISVTVFIAFILLGWLFTYSLGRGIEKEMGTSLLYRAKVAAAGLGSEDLEKIKSFPPAFGSNEYKEARDELLKMQSENSDTRYVYVIYLKGKDVVFLVDGEPLDSEDYTPPGDTWENFPSKVLAASFINGKSTVYGPYEDKWGTWVSAFVPIKNAGTDNVTAVIGMDIDTKHWFYRVERERQFGMLLLFIVFILLLTLNTTYYVNRLSESYLRKSEEKFFKAFNRSPVLAAITKLNDGRLIEVNDTMADVLGYSRYELVGRTTVDVGFFKDSYARREVMDEIKKRGSISGLELRFLSKSGKKITGLYYGSLIYINNAPHLVNVIQDVTELRAAEFELRKLSMAVEQNPATVVITDVKGNIEYVNPKFIEVTGYTFAEAIGQNPRILKTDELSQEAYKELWDTITVGKVWRGEFRNKKKNGDFYWESASIGSITDGEGNITNYIAVKEDITERKKIELELKKAQESLLDVMKIKDEFLSITSHDLKSPLGIVKTSMGLLLEEKGIGDTVKEYAQMSLRQANRGLKLINDLLNLKKLESGNVKLEATRFAVSDLIDEVLEDLRVNIEQSNVSIEVAKDSEYELTADYPKLVQLLSNLVDNALKYTEKGGKIKLTVSRVYDSIKVGIHDNGPGIPADKLSVIFEKYEQAGELAEKKKGHGIGLAIARMICDLHGGKIWAESKQGEGTTFYFEIPGVKDMSDAETMSALEEELYHPDAMEKTILIVDDMPDERIIASKIIRRAGFNVLEASEWKSALHVMKDYKIDAILLDIEMPEINGLELLDIIRRDKTMEELPVILYSSRFSEIENCSVYGANDYVNKSEICKATLIAKLKRVLKIG